MSAAGDTSLIDRRLPQAGRLPSVQKTLVGTLACLFTNLRDQRITCPKAMSALKGVTPIH